MRWLYDNAADSQGKLALMKVLDAALYPPSRAKKKAGDAPPSSPPPSAAAWRSTQNNAAPKPQASVRLGGGRRRGGKDDETYARAQGAVRPRVCVWPRLTCGGRAHTHMQRR